MRRLASLLLASGLAAAQDRETVVADLEPAPTATSVPRVTFPQASFTLTAERPEGLGHVAELGATARYALARIGGRTLPLAFDAPEGAFALGLCYGGGDQPVLGRARALGADSVAVEFADVPMGLTRWNVRLVYRGMDLQEAGIEPAAHRRGRAVLGGSIREVILVDGDGDGRWNGRDDRWVAFRPERARKVGSLRRPETFLLDEPQIPFEADGRALGVEQVSAEGTTLMLVLDRPARGMEDVLGRRYAEVRAEHFAAFDAEKEDFARRMGVDLARPQAKEPAPWRDEPLSKAKERARAERKPLLVCYFAETNPWCYRYEYYTFPDREVDALLRRFVLARIDAEKDPERSYQGSGARSIPALVPLTADGKAVPFTLRHRDGDGNVKDLPEPEKLVQLWQRPQELAENLRRILAAAGEG